MKVSKSPNKARWRPRSCKAHWNLALHTILLFISLQRCRRKQRKIPKDPQHYKRFVQSGIVLFYHLKKLIIRKTFTLYNNVQKRKIFYIPRWAKIKIQSKANDAIHCTQCNFMSDWQWLIVICRWSRLS